MKLTFKTPGYSLSALVVFTFFFYLMVKLTSQYIPFNYDAGFLRIKQDIVKSVSGYTEVFYVHVYTAILVLLAGFTQFSECILYRYKIVHKLAGRLYALVVLFLAAPSGIFLGFYANGAWHTRLSFIILGVLWLLFTAKAVAAVLKKQFIVHQNFMIRSFALALSAVTLRGWKVVIVYSFHTAPMDTYKIIAWLGWLPNLLLAEYLITRKNIA